MIQAGGRGGRLHKEKKLELNFRILAPHIFMDGLSFLESIWHKQKCSSVHFLYHYYNDRFGNINKWKEGGITARSLAHPEYLNT